MKDEGSRRIRVRSPANIALVKYMGKSSVEGNVPMHGSLSMTLKELTTDLVVQVRPAGARPSLIRASHFDGRPLQVSTKFEKHFWKTFDHASEWLERFGIPSQSGVVSVEVDSHNRFPADAGIASSASSFSAATLGALAARAEPEAFQRALASPDFRRAVAALSQGGSGSSCRSFEGPWVIWDESGVRVLPSQLPEMTDLVVVVSEGKKAISSSQAHLDVLTSPLFRGRVERVRGRLAECARAIEQGDRRRLAVLSWIESWEMHSLFHTSAKPFTYFAPETIAVLKFVEQEVYSENPPIVTMDAGPNVHILIPTEEAHAWEEHLMSRFPSAILLKDAQGEGASIEVDYD